MRVLRPADYIRTRWKNGGGETRQIAICPPAASAADFDWRVSMATVASNGPFSRFTDIDRTISILNGAGIELHVGSAPVHLTPSSAPFEFSGDDDAHARLLDDAVTDFNVMTSRRTYTHHVQRLEMAAADSVAVDRSVALLFCAVGAVTIDDAVSSERLAEHDAVLRGEDARQWRMTAAEPSRIYLVSIAPVTSTDQTSARFPV